MKLKKVLLVSFCVMIFLPVFLFAVAVCISGIYRINLIKSSYGIENLNYQHFTSSVQLLSEFTKDVHEELQELAEDDPDRFNDIAFLAEIDKRLENDASFLIVRKGEEIIYIGNNEPVFAFFLYHNRNKKISKAQIASIS